MISRSMAHLVQSRRISASRSRGPALGSVHPSLEILPSALCRLDVGPWNSPGVLAEHMKENNEVPRPSVENAMELSPVMAPELTELALDLRAVRERQGRIRGTQHVETVDLVVQDNLTLHRESIDEVVDWFGPVRRPIENRLQSWHETTMPSIADKTNRSFDAEFLAGRGNECSPSRLDGLRRRHEGLGPSAALSRGVVRGGVDQRVECVVVGPRGIDDRRVRDHLHRGKRAGDVVAGCICDRPFTSDLADHIGCPLFVQLLALAEKVLLVKQRILSPLGHLPEVSYVFGDDELGVAHLLGTGEEAFVSRPTLSVPAEAVLSPIPTPLVDPRSDDAARAEERDRRDNVFDPVHADDFLIGRRRRWMGTPVLAFLAFSRGTDAGRALNGSSAVLANTALTCSFSVEASGFEPPTSALRTQRSTN